MSEMEQRVSEAIRTARARGKDDVGVARAAIEAMREPTEAMIEAAYWSAFAENAVGVWDAMIDAALTPAPPSPAA